MVRHLAADTDDEKVETVSRLTVLTFLFFMHIMNKTEYSKPLIKSSSHDLKILRELPVV